MSHLNYLSRSMNQDNALRRNQKRNIQPEIPENTQMPIPEVMSENEEEMPDSPSKVENSPRLNRSKESNHPEATTQVVTPKTIAEEIISEMINIVFEAEDTGTEASSTIVSNTVLTQNINKIHKQVFVKVKVQDESSQEPQQ